MKQVVQNYRTGELLLEDVPVPQLREGGLLVRTVASAVSAGTERSKLDLARKSLVGKAMARPDQVKKVLETLKKEGIVNTYNKVRNKLDSLSPLGYSTAGIVVAVGDGCPGFAVGDAVACAGAGYANHAEVNWVPANLCAVVPAGVDLVEAAFTTIGAIALQGIRQSEATFGETIVVIGLGLIGQLTAQLLRASGCRVIGIDVDAWNVEQAQRNGTEMALLRGDDVVQRVLAATGHGADAVIITAAAPNNDPFVLAAEIARERARLVLVGAVPVDLPRSPAYEKELDIRFSRSYGPGRYDAEYEEKGRDYPIGYVRWTENRNMQAFLRALGTKQISLATIVSHRIPFAEAMRAYDLVSGKRKERFLGLALTYPAGEGALERRPVATPNVRRRHAAVNVGFIGAGSFAGGTLIPLLKASSAVSLVKVCTASGLTARDAAIRHGFASAVSDPADILDDESINVVFIATRHNSHASLTQRALARGKAVFVEKPLALTRSELDEVFAAGGDKANLMVGFNRRFSPHTERVRSSLAGVAGARVIHIRVNAGVVGPDSWIHDPEVGGGRWLGEGCHFVDLAQSLAESRPVRVYAAGIGMPDPGSMLRDNLSVTLEFENGSLASILYTSKGDMALGKERIEVFAGGISAVIDDFVTTTIVRGGRTESFKTKQDKGHREEISRFVKSVMQGGASPISLEDLRASSLATIAAGEAFAVDAAVMVNSLDTAVAV